MRCFATAILAALTISSAKAFEGSVPQNGESYYLYNIYQARFLNNAGKLDNENATAFQVNNGHITIGNKAWNLTPKGTKHYQLTDSNEFFAFEDKVPHPNYPDSENRARYIGGGITCQPTTNNTDRSHWLLISEQEYAEWMAKKKFTVASLNVDGMPKSVKVAGIYEVKLNEDATEGPGAAAIGKRLLTSGFDVVGVSEDFNYHSELWNNAWNNGQSIHYNATTHRGKITADLGAVSDYLNKKPILDSDGLCLFYRVGAIDQATVEKSEAWTEWTSHNGYDDYGADGLIRKGFRFYILKLEDGTEVDLYTMHMDAEASKEDMAAREKQLQQLADAIKKTNNKRPIIIIGDTNCRYTRDRLKEILIDGINSDERFTISDPWVLHSRNGIYPEHNSNALMASEYGYLKGEVVDKIFFINNKESKIKLTAETYAQDLSFVDAEGSPLCDHKPCVVTFSYKEVTEEEDDPKEEETDGYVFLRNRQTGRFLKSGGAWGTHSVVGNYPMKFTLEQFDGKYALKSPAGYLTSEADNTHSYIDGRVNEERSVKDWVLTEHDGFHLFTHNGKALSTKDPYFFNDDVNYRQVILDNIDIEDKHQQWEIVTRKQMMEEMLKATADNPVNSSWLMSNPNFDHNIPCNAYKNSISSDAKRMWSNLAEGNHAGNGSANYCAEAYVKACPATELACNHTTTWDINEQIKNIPNGFYRVSCQAFQRVNNDTKASANIFLYANSEQKKIQQMYSLKTVTEAIEGAVKVGDCYYPDDMKSAALFFNDGHYLNDLIVEVTDGTLIIGLKKTSTTPKSQTCWTCFDNFQLYYLGTVKPEQTYEQNVIAGTRKVELSADGTIWKMRGTWRETDMEELSSKLALSEHPTVIDASEATLVCRPKIVIPAFAPNTIIKVTEAKEIENSANVIDAKGECKALVLTDLHNFAPGQAFVAKSVLYKRNNTQGISTVCLPFEVKVTDFPESCNIFIHAETVGDMVRFAEANSNATIPAGTPFIVEDTNSAADAQWNISLSTDCSIIPSPSYIRLSEAENVSLYGTFVSKSIENGYLFNSDSKEFIKNTTAKVSPFRFSLQSSEADAPEILTLILGDMPTDISHTATDKADTTERIFDLYGRRVKCISRPGLYLKGHKKIVIKK